LGNREFLFSTIYHNVTIGHEVRRRCR